MDLVHYLKWSPGGAIDIKYALCPYHPAENTTLIKEV